MPSEVTSPLQGVVVSVNVSMGQAVHRGQTVVVVESMKMEHVIEADEDGVVFGIVAAPGDQVSPGDVLITLADPAPTESTPSTSGVAVAGAADQDARSAVGARFGPRWPK